MQKPQPQYRSPIYSYSKSREYLEKKYNYNERDFAGLSKYENKILKEINENYPDSIGWYSTKPIDMNKKQRIAYNKYLELQNKKPEYLDFWHWVVGNYEICNPCEIVFSQERFNEMSNEPEWIRTIYGYYLKEFADNNGEVEMEVSW